MAFAYWKLGRVYLELSGAGKGEKTDEKRTRFGFREIRFDAEGFFLNGEKIKISINVKLRHGCHFSAQDLLLAAGRFNKSTLYPVLSSQPSIHPAKKEPMHNIR